MSQLPDWHRLVVSAVDGELSHQERKKLREILRSNPEAKILLRDYRSQSKILSELPSPALPCDFASVFKSEPEILGSRTALHPPEKAFAFSRTQKVSSFATAAWVAIALGILLLTGIGLNYSFQPRITGPNTRKPNSNPETFEKSVSNQAKSGNLASEGEVLTFESAIQNSIESPKTSTTLEKSAVLPDIFVKKQKTLEASPNPNVDVSGNSGLADSTNRKGPKDPVDETLFTAPFANSGTLVEPKILVPYWIAWEDKLLSERLKDASRESSAPIVLEIPCNDSIAVSGHLVQVLKNLKLGVIVDQLAEDRLIQKNIRSHFAVCLEGFTHAQLEKLLSDLKKEVERSPNKTAIPPLGLGITLLSANGDIPAVFSSISSSPARGKSGEPLNEIPATVNGSKPGAKNSSPARKSLQPSFNRQGKLDALVMAQSPYYPEVRTSASSQEVSLFRNLKKVIKEPEFRVYIFIRQLHI